MLDFVSIYLSNSYHNPVCLLEASCPLIGELKHLVIRDTVVSYRSFFKLLRVYCQGTLVPLYCVKHFFMYSTLRSRCIFEPFYMLRHLINFPVSGHKKVMRIMNTYNLIDCSVNW